VGHIQHRHQRPGDAHARNRPGKERVRLGSEYSLARRGRRVFGTPQNRGALDRGEHGSGTAPSARRVIRTVLGLGVFGTLGISLAYLLIGDLVSNLLNSPVLVALTGLMAGWIAIAVVQEITAEAFRSFHDMRHGRGEEQDRQEEPRPKEGREAVRHPLSTSAGGRRRPRARSRSTSRPARPGVVWRRSCASPGPP
jgi:hypothetical protein